MQKITKEALKATITRRRAQTDQLLNQPKDEVDAYHEAGYILTQVVGLLSAYVADEEIGEAITEIVRNYNDIAERIGVLPYIYEDDDTEDEA